MYLPQSLALIALLCSVYKGELLFSSVGPLTLIYGHGLCFSSNMHHILAQHIFRVYLDLYAPDFYKSTSKYLLFTKVVRKHEYRCFRAMYHFRMQCCFFLLIILSCSIILTFPNSNYRCIFV